MSQALDFSLDVQTNTRTMEFLEAIKTAMRKHLNNIVRDKSTGSTVSFRDGSKIIFEEHNMVVKD